MYNFEAMSMQQLCQILALQVCSEMLVRQLVQSSDRKNASTQALTHPPSLNGKSKFVQQARRDATLPRT